MTMEANRWHDRLRPAVESLDDVSLAFHHIRSTTELIKNTKSARKSTITSTCRNESNLFHVIQDDLFDDDLLLHAVNALSAFSSEVDSISSRTPLSMLPESSDTWSFASKQSLASDLTGMLSEILGRGSHQTSWPSSGHNSKAKRKDSSTPSAHLTKSASSHDDDSFSGQRSVYTLDSDLSGLLSELLAASMVPEYEEDHEEDEDRMPLLHEDEEYSCIESYNTEFGLDTTEALLDTSGSVISDMTGILSEILSSVAPPMHKSIGLDKHGLRLESEPHPMKSILDECRDCNKTPRKPCKFSRDGKKNKKSKMNKREPRLKKKAAADASVVNSLRALIEEQRQLNDAQELVQSVATLKPKDKRTHNGKMSVSPGASDPIPQICRSPTSVRDESMNAYLLAQGTFDSHTPTLPLQHDGAVREIRPPSPHQIFSILPEPMQNWLLSLHHDWLVSTSQIMDLPIPSIPIDSDEKSVTSDVSGLSSVFQGISKAFSPPVQYPGVLGEYRVEIDSEGDATTCLWYRKTDPPKPSRPYRKVTFNTVHVREYESILGDNPSCKEGPSMSIGWKYKKERVYGIDIFDDKPDRRREWDLLLSRQEREATLLKLGYTRKELNQAMLSSIKIHHERQQSSTQNSGIQGFDEIIAGAGRKVTMFVSNLNLEDEAWSGRN
jgi:hypothetical protein